MNLLVLFMEPEMRDIPRPIAWVRVSSIVDFLTDIERIALFSFLRSRHKKLGLGFDIPKKYLRYACLVGADHKTSKKVDLEEIKQDEASKFISGYYYSKGFHYQSYKPELVKTDKSFLHYCLPVSERLYNDCLIHSVNFALRHPWFTCREQVVRLMHKRMKKGDIDQTRAFKTESGVRINHLKEFFLDGSVSYSIGQVA
jgi:hypothetical protein